MSTDNNIFTKLRNWLAGDKQSEQPLREAVRKDAFLRDAMAGYDEFPDSDHAARLERLRGKLSERTRGAKRRNLVWYATRIAAAASILLVATWFVSQQFAPSTGEIAQTDAPAQTESSELTVPETYAAEPEEELTPLSAEPNPPVEAVKPSQDQPEPQASQLAAKEKREEKARQSAAQRTTATPRPPEPKEEIATVDEVEEEAPIVFSEADAEPPAAPPAVEGQADEVGKAMPKEAAAEPSPSRRLKDTAQPAPRSFRGVVLDEQGQPLIGASIIEPGTTNGTATDFDGKFNLQIQPTTEQLEIAYTGYETVRVPVEGKSFAEVQMEEGVVLDEIVVTDYRAPLVTQDNTTSGTTVTSKKLKKQESDLAKVSRAFKRFVKKNQQYPEAAKANDIHGEVIIEFDIDANNRPVNFRTKKSLGYGCDEEALRLLKEGPDWKDGSKGRVQFEF